MKIIVSPIPNDETQNIMALLPVDIVYYNILTKLPPKSLLRFKSVCKDWYSLINSSNFINIHHQHTLKSYNSCDFLVVFNYTFRFTYCFYMYLEAPNYTNGKCIDLENIESSYGNIIGSSNGLICFKFIGSGFLLCNPITGEYSRLIESPSLASVDFLHENYGFGYDEVSHDYKIVNIECIGHTHVYSTNSRLWKKVQKNPNSIESFDDCDRSVIVNNRLHWIIYRNNNGITGIRIILTLDLHAEEFREISYPTCLERDGRFRLMVSCGRLCTLVNNFNEFYQENISMWVMKEYGVVESWTKLYDVGGEQISLMFFQIMTHRSRRDGEEALILRNESEFRKEFVWYNLKNKSINGKANDPERHVGFSGDKWVCIPSLAPIPGNDPNNRCPTDLAIVEDINKEIALAYSAYVGDDGNDGAHI